MSNIDARIREALGAEDAALLKSLSADPGITALIADSFRGRMRWMTVLGLVYSFLFFGLALYTGWEFLQQTELRELALWGSAFWLCILAVTALKLWFWMDMHKNQIVREVKRVELQIAALAARLPG